MQQGERAPGRERAERCQAPARFRALQVPSYVPERVTAASPAESRREEVQKSLPGAFGDSNAPDAKSHGLWLYPQELRPQLRNDYSVSRNGEDHGKEDGSNGPAGKRPHGVHA